MMPKNVLDSGIPIYQRLSQARLYNLFDYSNVVKQVDVSVPSGYTSTVLIDVTTPDDFLGLITTIEVGNADFATMYNNPNTASTDRDTKFDVLVAGSSIFSSGDKINTGKKSNELPHYFADNLIIPIIYPATSIRIVWYATQDTNFIIPVMARIMGYYYR